MTTKAMVLLIRYHNRALSDLSDKELLDYHALLTEFIQEATANILRRAK